MINWIYNSLPNPVHPVILSKTLSLPQTEVMRSDRVEVFFSTLRIVDLPPLFRGL